MPTPTWLRRLDYLPTWAAWTLGLGAGALAGAGLAGGAPRLLGVLGFVVLLGTAAALAWSGEPVAVIEGPESAPRQEPAPVYASRFVDLVPIPGGRFPMGSPESEGGRNDDEGPVHDVWVSSFACMRTPVTRRFYAEIMGSDPGWPEGEADDRPVNDVSWYDAAAFCIHLSEREGLTPCYGIDGEKVTWNRTADGFRLLTEAEWEYACRAGSVTRWSFGDDEEKLGQHAWYRDNSNGEPQSVGRKDPNAWGLHDMHGNVHEWCWDWHGPYSVATVTDPAGPLEGESRVLRGGSFHDSPWNLRSTDRVRLVPTVRIRFIGFRCARAAPHPPGPPLPPPSLPPGEGGTGRR
jgi:formylglycine-generating enzyme required for sulfatase activity